MADSKILISTPKDRISELPDELRNHILSKLDTQESMKTSLLSKAWRDAWLTQRSLDFDKEFYNQYFREGEFISDKLNCFYNLIHRVLERRSRMLKNKGLSTELKLFIQTEKPHYRTSAFWANRCLHYAVTNFDVECLEVMYSPGYVVGNFYTFSNHFLQLVPSLKLLNLKGVELDQQLVDNLAVSCPLIESLTFSACGLLEDVNVSGLRKLVTATIVVNVLGNLTKRLEIHAPNLETLGCYQLSKSLGPGYPKPLPTLEVEVGVACKGLKRMVMSNIRFTKDSLKHLQTHFLSLEVLDFGGCIFPSIVNLSSRSLEVLHLHPCDGMTELHIDAPNLKKFYYSDYTHVPVVFSWNAFAPVESRVNIFRDLIYSDHQESVEFLKQLYQCSQYLAVDVYIGYNKALNENRELSPQPAQPVYDMIKHLKLRYDLWLLDHRQLPEQSYEILSALWLFPNLETLEVSYITTKEQEFQSVQQKLQFKYKEDVDGSDDSLKKRLQEIIIGKTEGSTLCVASLRNLLMQNGFLTTNNVVEECVFQYRILEGA